MTHPDRPHHHGNLRHALIEAGLALLAEGGRPALTLRQAAARAGVSHAAPAHHFDGLPGLLTAITAQAFALFTQSMTTARDAAGPDAFARLDGICAGYLTFAQTHDGLFDLMFNAPDVHRADPELQQNAYAAYGVLRDACQPFVGPNRPNIDLEVSVWSMVHGFALLRFAIPPGQASPYRQHGDFTRLLRNLIGPPR